MQINTVEPPMRISDVRPQRDVIASTGSGPNLIEVPPVQLTAYEDIRQ